MRSLIVHQLEGLLAGGQEGAWVFGQELQTVLDAAPNLQVLLILLNVDAGMPKMLEFMFAEDLCLPALRREVPALEHKEPVSDHEVDIPDDDRDRFHDVPGEVEVDEVVDQGQLSDQEVSEPPHLPS